MWSIAQFLMHGVLVLPQVSPACVKYDSNPELNHHKLELVIKRMILIIYLGSVLITPVANGWKRTSFGNKLKQSWHVENQTYMENSYNVGVIACYIMQLHTVTDHKLHPLYYKQHTLNRGIFMFSKTKLLNCTIQTFTCNFIKPVHV